MKNDGDNLDDLMTEFKKHLKELRLAEIQKQKEAKESMVSKQIQKLLGDDGESIQDRS